MMPSKPASHRLQQELKHGPQHPAPTPMKTNSRQKFPAKAPVTGTKSFSSKGKK